MTPNWIPTFLAGLLFTALAQSTWSERREWRGPLRGIQALVALSLFALLLAR